MRPAGTFATILAVGVIIVLIYQWSGDSIVVLIMCIVTLFALLALWDRKPWAAAQDRGRRPDGVDESDLFGHRRQGRAAAGNEALNQQGAGAGKRAAGGSGHEPVDDTNELDDGNRLDESNELDQANGLDDDPTVPPPQEGGVWRSRFDVAITDDGVTGLELGFGQPRLHRWETIRSADTDWSEAIAVGEMVERRLGLHLGLVQTEDQNQTVQLMFGQNQDPDRVVTAIVDGVRRARMLNSRFHGLSPAERTRQLASALSPTPVNLSKDIPSPELLYQEARRALLTSHALRRVGRDADADDVAKAIGQLLSAHQIVDLDGLEAGGIGAAANRGDIDGVYDAAGRLVEDRGYHLAFIRYGGEDHLLGLLRLADAPEWDGQAIGSGLTTISLEPPVYS